MTQEERALDMLMKRHIRAQLLADLPTAMETAQRKKDDLKSGQLPLF